MQSTISLAKILVILCMGVETPFPIFLDIHHCFGDYFPITLHKYRTGRKFRGVENSVQFKISQALIPLSTCIIFVSSATHEKREIKNTSKFSTRTVALILSVSGLLKSTSLPYNSVSYISLLDCAIESTRLFLSAHVPFAH